MESVTEGYYGVLFQIEDCRTRYNGDADHHQRRKSSHFQPA